MDNHPEFTKVDTKDYKAAREALVKHLQLSGIRNPAVLEAIRTVPRHCFVPQQAQDLAYRDSALAIDCEQTISQPYMVAMMTEALLEGIQEKEWLGKKKANNQTKILEVGTGSGYQAAVLAQLVSKVYTIERVKPLADSAKNLLHQLNITNIECLYGDGSKGLPEYAPFDGIIVTAAPTELPKALLEQLADSARLVIPIGEAGFQELVVYTRHNHEYKQEHIMGVRFVALIPGVRE